MVQSLGRGNGRDTEDLRDTKDIESPELINWMAGSGRERSPRFCISFSQDMETAEAEGVDWDAGSRGEQTGSGTFLLKRIQDPSPRSTVTLSCHPPPTGLLFLAKFSSRQTAFFSQLFAFVFLSPEMIFDLSPTW